MLYIKHNKINNFKSIVSFFLRRKKKLKSYKLSNFETVNVIILNYFCCSMLNMKITFVFFQNFI